MGHQLRLDGVAEAIRADHGGNVGAGPWRLAADIPDSAADRAAQAFELATRTGYKLEEFACQQKQPDFMVRGPYETSGVKAVQSEMAKTCKGLVRGLNATFD